MQKGFITSIGITVGVVLGVVLSVLSFVLVLSLGEDRQNLSFDAPQFFEKAAKLDYSAASVSLDEFLELRKRADTVVVDLRSLRSYEHGHVEGAIHLAGTDITKAKLEKAIPNSSDTIILYCDFSLMPVRSLSLMHMSLPQFVALGYTKVRMLDPVYRGAASDTDYTEILPWVGR